MPDTNDHASFDTLLSLLPVADVARVDLAQRMRAPDRYYHSDAHIGSMWTLNVALAREAGLDEAAGQRRLACAIAYHDSVLVPGRTDNERRSAELWLAASDGGDTSPEDRVAVAAMIEATADHVGAAYRADARDVSDHETRWLLDLDLASLGAAPDLFDRNTSDLRREAAHLDEDAWRASLVAFFSDLLAADPLYRCSPTARHFEVPARTNMLRVLSHLSVGMPTFVQHLPR